MENTEDWGRRMLLLKNTSLKKKIINFLVFLVLWCAVYYLIRFNFGVLAFMISYMLVFFRTDSDMKNGIIFLASEFDRHHNQLNDGLQDFNWYRNQLTDDIQQLRDRIEELEKEKAP